MSNIALQVERLSGNTVTTGSNVIFDSVVYSSGNISYNAGTGVITFNEAGRYVIDWWVAVQSVQSLAGAIFSIRSSQGDDLKGNSPLRTGEVVGVGIVDVTVAPVTVSLVNISTDTAYYSTQLPVKATLVVIEDDDTTGPTGDSVIIGLSK